MYPGTCFLTPMYRLATRQALRCFSTSSTLLQPLAPRVAIVLSGCGVYDGTEIHEASATMVHLSREKTSFSIYAPDIPQMHVICHNSGEVEEDAKRNVLSESARIARDNISPLSELKVEDHDAVIFPGVNLYLFIF